MAARPGARLGRLVELQAALLRRAWGWVAPGGRLVYCVCSLLPDEGEAQAARFLAETPDARVGPAGRAALGIEPGWIDAIGGLRTRPDFGRSAAGSTASTRSPSRGAFCSYGKPTGNRRETDAGGTGYRFTTSPIVRRVRH